MKIVVLRSRNPFYESSASANRWRTLIEGLIKQGAEIHLAVLGGYWSKVEHDDFLLSKKAVVKTYYPVFRPMNFKLFRGFYRVFFLIIDIIIKYNLRNILHKFQPDIVWSCRSLIEMKALYSIVTPNKKFLSMIELSEFDDYDLKSKDCKKMNFFRTHLGNKIDIFNIMTNRLLEHYNNISKKNAHFILTPMTVDLSRFNCPISNEFPTPYFVYCGGLTNRKDGIDILIKSFAKISKKISHTLYLIGDRTSDYQEQRNIIESNNLHNRVIFLGGKQRDEIPPILKGASVLCLARPDSRQAQGGFPTKLGEYLATGNPVCVTKVGEISLYLENLKNAFLAEPGDVNSFADALENACTNRELALRIGAAGRQVAEKYFNMEIQTKKLYSNLIKYKNILEN